MRRKRLGGLAAAVFLLVSSTAGARSVRDEPYSLETTWNAAMRLVRVDLGMPITERDQDLGYFTFSYREGRRVVPGSMELVRTEVDGRPGARIIVQIPEMPSYVESMILARLTRKLHSEFGEPPPVSRLREDISRAIAGSLDLVERLAVREQQYPAPKGIAQPRIELVPGASSRATVLEVRAHDAPGLLHRVTAAIAQVGVSITAARVATLGSEVVDVFYMVDGRGEPLSANSGESVLTAVASVLGEGE